MKLIALTIPGDTPVKIIAPDGIPQGFSLGSLVSAAISMMTIVGVILALFYLIYGGFRWMQAKGDKESLDKARRIITYSIFGLIIMSLAFVIVNVIYSAIGFDTRGTIFK